MLFVPYIPFLYPLGYKDRIYFRYYTHKGIKRLKEKEIISFRV
ncbi:hypothetical protein BACUNI_00345 [Bacteroides uniformis ATCC 8492]|uniref:Uncharacterized protein n=1 Tax=Bacteroides uniformis (strain ATCC 8492 / DSM 6597 / CCUG 4942 / CIP 103695 / JCM 5828 / KCTC 5204 / NCTC 13054 / VPI 0061) TaxID=411479 RepID=A0ABC9NH77_BACUC|nr:hypothetical protein BACUNI_00345 [Bacteroides uniformis ATCC 8492]